ncbi:MAG: hypothetical protein E7Z93_02200 [Cyanobacteria bacterium SIG32]|nr:hypothetical protein [Cyanobacteria bacterium SIG32]
MVKSIALAIQRGLKSKCLQSVIRRGDRTILLFRHPKTGATVVKSCSSTGIVTAGYKAGERTNKIVKDFNVFGNLEQRAHLMPSVYNPDKLVQQLSFANNTYVAKNGKLIEYLNGKKISEVPRSMEKVVDSIVWA